MSKRTWCDGSGPLDLSENADGDAIPFPFSSWDSLKLRNKNLAGIRLQGYACEDDKVLTFGTN